MFELVLCTAQVIAWKMDYSRHLKTGLSSIQMVIFQTQFTSGFQMVKSAI
jgi:hypothetical protein